MKIKTMYDAKPKINCQMVVKNFHQGYVALAKLINEHSSQIIILELYPGVRIEELKIQLFSRLRNCQLIFSETAAISKTRYRQQIFPYLTNDPLFGRLCPLEFKDFFSPIRVQKLKNKIAAFTGKSVIFGINASQFATPDAIIFYFDMCRWELQLRARQQERIFFQQSLEKTTSQNFKRGYFIEWRMADRIKQQLWKKFHYYVDTTEINQPKIISAQDFNQIITTVASQPFRLVPYFDRGIWGGTWMKNHLGLNNFKSQKLAWGFDGVPEENSLLIQCNANKTQILQMPAINIVFFAPQELLGRHVFQRFGAEFPIRFDFLDTIQGGNLSLQVHPTTTYIQKEFNMPYTQEESYYFLDVDKQAHPVCYLGLKNTVLKTDFENALKKSQKTHQFNVEQYVNAFPVKKHDHILHPAGTIHASGAGNLVLEISSTPYIFTFKLWDWNRLDLNGKPRPINITRGLEVIQFDRNTNYCERELINQFKILQQTPTVLQEHTGLHPLQFIETHRWSIAPGGRAILTTHDSVNMLNLVSGNKINVLLPTDKTFNYEIHFAETFIVPAACQEYYIQNLTHQPIILLQAFVRPK